MVEESIFLFYPFDSFLGRYFFYDRKTAKMFLSECRKCEEKCKNGESGQENYDRLFFLQKCTAPIIQMNVIYRVHE